MGYFDNMQKKDNYLNQGQNDFTEDYGIGGGANTWSKETQDAANGKKAGGGGGGSDAAAAASLWSPAIGVAGMFLSNLMNQRAAAEAEKKKLAVELALKQGKDVSDSSQQMINVYKDILTRG